MELRIDGKSNSDFGGGHIRWDLLREIARVCNEGQAIDIVDLSGAVHLKPYVIALVVAACRKVGANSLEVRWPIDPEVSDHLKRLGLEGALAKEKRAVDRRWTNVPLEVLEDRPSDGFAWSLVEILEKECESFPPGMKAEISDSIDEMILNALTHSDSPVGCVVVGQAFPQSRRLEATILDLGITIRGHLSKSQPDLDSDSKAVQKAIIDGVTGTIGFNRFGEPNSGAGLATVRRFMERKQGELAILSGEALMTFGKLDYEHAFYQRFPGTLVNLNFNLA